MHRGAHLRGSLAPLTFQKRLKNKLGNPFLLIICVKLTREKANSQCFILLLD